MGYGGFELLLNVHKGIVQYLRIIKKIRGCNV